NIVTFSRVSPPTELYHHTIIAVMQLTPLALHDPLPILITVRVTDNGAPPSSDTKSFTVVVTEANSAPVLIVPTDQTVTELGTLTVTNSASDADVPANTLTFSLVSAPLGVNLDPSTGVLSWTATEKQGPLPNSIPMCVTDNGAPPSSDTKSFTVVVTESNSAPVLTVTVDQTITELSTFTVTNSASDADLP